MLNILNRERLPDQQTAVSGVPEKIAGLERVAHGVERDDTLPIDQITADQLSGSSSDVRAREAELRSEELKRIEALRRGLRLSDAETQGGIDFMNKQMFNSITKDGLFPLDSSYAAFEVKNGGAEALAAYNKTILKVLENTVEGSQINWKKFKDFVKENNIGRVVEWIIDSFYSGNPYKLTEKDLKEIHKITESIRKERILTSKEKNGEEVLYKDAA